MVILSTIGYEKASIEDFLETLKVAGVNVLVDVRQLPISRRKGFSKKKLGLSLESVGIRYVHLVGLGDPKEGRIAAKEGRYDDFIQVFTQHMKTTEAKADLLVAADLAESGHVCLMCYERDHASCHRKLLAESISSMIGASIQPLGIREGLAKNERKTRSREDLDTREGTSAHW